MVLSNTYMVQVQMRHRYCYSFNYILHLYEHINVRNICSINGYASLNIDWNAYYEDVVTVNIFR